MICFCDIPISRIGDHTAFYGDYGLGMTKEWGLRNNLEPLLYTPKSGALTELVTYLHKVDMKDADGKNTVIQNDLNLHFFRIIPMIKPVSGNMVIGGTIVEKDFHQENEWRFVPKNFDIIFKDKFDDQRDSANVKVQNEKLSFSPSDVIYIFVKRDAEIPSIFDFIQNNLGHFPLNDIKILSSRIVSLQTLSVDM